MAPNNADWESNPGQQPVLAPAPTAVAPVPRRSPLVLVAALSVALLAALVYIVVLHGRLAEVQSQASQAIEAHLQTIALQTQQVEALDSLARRVEKFNREFGASVGRLQVDENLEASLRGLAQKAQVPEEARKTLEEFEAAAAEIAQMTATMKEFERYLGAPATVKRGESHAQIARAYLVEQAALPPQEADAVLRRTALAWDVEPGNLVFNLYRDGVLLSTVTQGTARRSPLLAQWAKRRASTARLQELEEKVRGLEARLAETAAKAAADAAPALDAAP